MFEFISNNANVILLGLSIGLVIILIVLIVICVRFGVLNKRYKRFMSGADGRNLEKTIMSRFEEMDKTKVDIDRLYKELESVNENLLCTYQKTGIVKYDAFKEMGGKLSFVLVLLDKDNNGVLLNSVHSSREGCYIYLKEVIRGESFLKLSEDEMNALNKAKNANNYME